MVVEMARELNDDEVVPTVAALLLKAVEFLDGRRNNPEWINETSGVIELRPADVEALIQKLTLASNCLLAVADMRRRQ